MVTGHIRDDQSTRNKMWGYYLLVAAYLALTWTLPFFPTQDGPSHVYNLAILHDLINGGRQWGGVFSYHLSATPNLGFNIVAYPLLAFVSPLVAERIFISVYIMAMSVAVPVLLRSFGREPLPLSYLLFPVLFNFPFLMGFYSYAMAVPLFLLAFCLAWRVREGALWQRLLCVTLSGAVIYFFHMIAFLMFIASVAAITLGRCQRRGRTLTWWLKEITVISPLILTVVHYIANSGNSPIRSLRYQLSPDRLFNLSLDLITFSTVTFHSWQLIASCLPMCLVVVLAIAGILSTRKRRGAGEPDGEALSTVAILAAMLLMLYFLAPSQFGEGRFFNERFPWVILIVALPLLEFSDAPYFRRLATIALAGCAWLFVAMNAVVLGEQSAQVGRFVAGGEGMVPQNSCLLTYKKRSRVLRIDPLLHASSHYGLKRGCVDVGNYEAQAALFPVRFRKEFPAPPSFEDIENEPENIKLENFPCIEYLLAWEIPGRETAHLGKNFSLLYRHGDLTLWKRK